MIRSRGVVWSVGGSDDRSLSVGVHPVGGPDLDVGKPGIGERASELTLGQGPGDAPGPLSHVGLRGLVHAFVGDDVGDRQASTGP